jgi:hypothetical protein
VIPIFTDMHRTAAQSDVAVHPQAVSRFTDVATGAISGHRFDVAVTIALALAYGMRRGEVLGLSCRRSTGTRALCG